MGKIVILLLLFWSFTFISCSRSVSRMIIVNVAEQDSISDGNTELEKQQRKLKGWRTATIVLGTLVVIYFFPFEELK